MSKLKNVGLSLALFVLFIGALAGQIAAGLAVYNQEQAEHGGATVGLDRYLASGDFWEATFEN